MIRQRNIAIYIILSVLTCGIYNLIWIYELAEDINIIDVDTASKTSGIMVVLYSILTCGIYFWYWLYRSGDRLDRIRYNNGRNSANLGLIYVILGILGLGLISEILIQVELNEYANSKQ